VARKTGDGFFHFSHRSVLDVVLVFCAGERQGRKILVQVLPDPLKRFVFPSFSFSGSHDLCSVLNTATDLAKIEARAKPMAYLMKRQRLNPSSSGVLAITSSIVAIIVLETRS